MQLVAISGFQGSGKDTVAKILVEEYGYIKLSFADSLKNAISTIFNWDRQLLEGDTEESRSWRETVDEWWSKRLEIPLLTPRWILQNIGTEVLRNHFHSDIWLASLENKLQTMNSGKFVISDCRFPNEMEMIKRLGGTLIRVNRDIQNIIYNHESETAWTICSFDYVLENNGTIVDLKNAVTKIFE
jgi:adenylate kinase family enzyme